MNFRDCAMKCRPYVGAVWNIIGIYIIWMIIHYTSAHLYAAYCTPYTFMGFLATPLLVLSPHCTALRWCIIRGADTITTMWIAIGTSIAARLGGYAIE